MESLFLLIPLSLAIVALAVWLFFRMSDTGQFDDMEGPAHSILMDDDRPAAGGRPAQGVTKDAGTARVEGAEGAERGANASPSPPRDQA